MTKATNKKIPVHVSIDADIMKYLIERREGTSISLSIAINDVLRKHCALSRYKHVKRGTTYSVIGRFEVQTSEPIVEGKWIVAYQCNNGSKWARPEDEFFDGRFVRVDLDGAETKETRKEARAEEALRKERGNV